MVFKREKSVIIISSTTEFMILITNSLDEKNHGYIYGQAKRFISDSISDSSLLINLYNLGLRDKSYDWIESYLYNRQQYIELSVPGWLKYLKPL